MKNEIKKLTELFAARYSEYQLVESSIQVAEYAFFAMARKGTEKCLVIGTDGSGAIPDGFRGSTHFSAEGNFFLCSLNHQNAEAIRLLFPFTKPVTIGKANSFGYGDRLGNAGPAHLKSLIDSDSGFQPILAQQSIRELDRTGRTADEVMDAATWTVFQLGYTDGFGSDADHLKTTDDIDRMIRAGFTMFTIDPSDYVDNRIVNMDDRQLMVAFRELPWKQLTDDPDNMIKRYAEKPFLLQGDLALEPSESDILRAAVKYGRVVLHTVDMVRHLESNYAGHDTEVELSVDETPHPTTPEEHLYIVAELQRLGVEPISLAPRFCGDFEKGIDFKGDLNAFRDEYLLHQAIAASYGGYKLSIHSGSDKLSVYEAIGELGVGTVHVKTAGTSYLEALRAVALTDTGLFREILAFSKERFETDRVTYHISAKLSGLSDPDDYSDDELPMLLEDDNARQIFHVTFGSVLTHPGNNGRPDFCERIMQTLAENEEIYEDCLYRHFRKHIRPFVKVYSKEQ